MEEERRLERGGHVVEVEGREREKRWDRSRAAKTKSRRERKVKLLQAVGRVGTGWDWVQLDSSWAD